MIFPGAFPAHRKYLHRGPFAVVGQRFENRKPRPALRAVDEGMKIPPVCRVKKLLLTLRADRNIRGDKDLSLSPDAFDDLKVTVFLRFFFRNILYIHLQDGCPLRRLLPDKPDKILYICERPLRDNLDAGACIGNCAVYPRTLRVAGDRRPEADTLHDTINPDFLCDRIHSVNVSSSSSARNLLYAVFSPSLNCPFSGNFSEKRQIPRSPGPVLIAIVGAI